MFHDHVEIPCNALAEDIRLIPEVSIDDFAAHILPGLPPSFGDGDTALQAVMKALMKKPPRSPAALKVMGKRYQWRAMPQQPKASKGSDREVFQKLEGVASDILTAIEECKLVRRTTEQHFFYVNNDTRTPGDGLQRDVNKSRPDGFFLTSTGKSAHERGSGYSWLDIGPVGEFKKDNTGKDFYDDARKVLWSMNIIMRDDPRRRAAYGFTIENTTARLWYCDRTQVLVSSPFDFFQEPKLFVAFFLRVMFAEETALGWDPTIVQAPRKRTRHTQDTSDPASCAYDITVHHVVDCVVTPAVYRTQELISSAATDGTYGRGTRVWKARRVGANGLTEGPVVVIKDYWVDSDRMRDAVVIQALRHDVKDEPVWKHPLLEDHVPDIAEYGDVRIGEFDDRTPSFEHLVRRDASGAVRSVSLISALYPSRQQDDHIRSHSSQSFFVERVPPKILFLNQKTHHRVVFKQYGHALHKEGSLKTIFSAIYDVVQCLYVMHSMGWVHRDISTGNILVVYERGKPKGMLTDFEYAQRWDRENTMSHKRTGTEYFMSVEADRGWYLFNTSVIHDEQTAFNRPQSEPFMKDRDSLAKTEPLPPQLPSFRYHPLNDWESLYWVAMYMLIDHIIHESRPTQSEAALQNQRFVARSLFYDYGSRRDLILAPGLTQPEMALIHSIHADLKNAVSDILVPLRLKLHLVYRKVEEDRTTDAPDGQASIDLICKTDIPDCFARLKRYFETRGSLRVKPLPLGVY